MNATKNMKQAAWPCGTPRSVDNAFTGHIPHSVPLRDEFAFRTRVFSQWLVLVRDAPLSHPSWVKFRNAPLAKDRQPVAKKKPRGRPITVSVVPTIQGLSAQAQAQLAKAPRSIGIGSLSDGNRRSGIKKAAI